jgi:ABC-type lipoprotein release transport system permease subunit
MKYVLKELRRHLWRTVFSIAGYAVATVFILIISSIAGSNKIETFGILKSTGTHFIVYVPSEAACCTNNISNGSVIAEGVRTMMLDRDMIRAIKNVNGVRDAAPCILYRMYDAGFTSDITISGIDTSSVATKSNACSRTNLIVGKFLSDKQDELVAEQSFATAHNLSLGDTVNIFGGKITIAGIVNSGIKPVRSDFYAPIEIVRRILRDKLQCNSPNFDMNIVLVEVADARRQEEVMATIRNMMYKFAVSSYNCYEPASKVMSMIDRSYLGLAFLIFIFLIVFSAKTQLTALIERFREVGILKSLGWSDFDLSKNIVLISFIQAVIGVSLGIALGEGIIYILHNAQNPLFRVSGLSLKHMTIPLLYLLSLAGALIASLFPILKIYRTKAGEIIKNYL